MKESKYWHTPPTHYGPPVPIIWSRWSVDTGVMEFSCPARMSAECFHELEEVMVLFMRQIKRIAKIEHQDRMPGSSQ